MINWFSHYLYSADRVPTEKPAQEPGKAWLPSLLAQAGFLRDQKQQQCQLVSHEKVQNRDS